MQKTAQVIALHENNLAELSVKRDSACGDCASCGACSGSCLRLEVPNVLGAKIGDRVTVETASGLVLGIAALIYLLPILMFFAGYLIGTLIGFSPILLGAVGFVLALAAAVILNRKLSGRIRYRMTAFSEED